MAIQMKFDVPNTGLSVVDAYHVITQMDVNVDRNEVTVIVSIFATSSVTYGMSVVVGVDSPPPTRPMGSRGYVIDLSEVGGKSTVSMELMYNKLKSLPEYATAIDV